MKLTINSKEITAEQGKSILEIARENGIEIPALCHDERLAAFGSCGICTVEIEGSPRLFRACSTLAADGMAIFTNTERVRKNRKTALELLLSDHKGDCRPPCMLACPAQTDCQGYVRKIADGDYDGAVKTIMDKIPLPSSIGRVCPHPCEDACRRQLVEEPISIAALKYHVADIADVDKITPQIETETGKSIAVIGGGPGGLSAAYFLRLKGHKVTVFDSMPQMGGMLRYGIPEYRLPKAILQKEIDNIGKIGVEFKNNEKVSLADVKGKYDAVIVAIGAWVNSGIRCDGENFNGVLGGIDFLREQTDVSGKKVCVVGGGNTAMDVCRTAVRLGAKAVYNIYRRTKNEMPAEKIEIAEAEEEGVIFKNLTNPAEIIGDNFGKVEAVKLQIMELGEPDSSGRRAPVAVEGKFEILDVDVVISAIGQKANLDGFGELSATKWGTITADEHTATNIDGVFAIGDATNKGADIAISAIGEAKKAAEAVDMFLKGDKSSEKSQYLVKTEKTQEDFADLEKKPRVKIQHRDPAERRNDFKEISFSVPAVPQEAAKKEAARCLECGCLDYYECLLIKYANEYDVNPERFSGVTHCGNLDNFNGEIPGVMRTPEKCVTCGLCVRLCEEEVKAGVLGFVGRGFDTAIMPAGDLSRCEGCGKCAEVCPTGALM